MNIKTLLFAGAVVVMAFSGNSLAQDNAWPVQGCASGNCGTAAVGNQYFGYPSQADCGYNSGACNSCGKVGGCACFQHLKDKWEHACDINKKVCDRNRAWPKPFDCADRQLYFSIWEPMIDAGYEKHCTLTQAHFNHETNELNNYGQSAVSGIMRNLPRHRKTIFIHRDVDQSLSDARMNAVRDAINTWYGTESAATIAFTDTLPTRAAGGRTEIINRLYNDGTPPPVLPVATGSGGLGSSN